jgi:hypothetical protein
MTALSLRYCKCNAAMGTDVISSCLQVPYTFVRGSSDYVHLPLSTDGSGVWSDIETVPAVDFINGYSYAVLA